MNDVTTVPSWDTARAHWSASFQHLSAALQERIAAGLELRALKGDRSIREFLVEANERLRGLPGVSRATIGRALQLADHADLIARHSPDSENAALRLIKDHARPCLTTGQQSTRELPTVSHAAKGAVSRPAPVVSHAGQREPTERERALFSLEWLQAGVAFAPSDEAAQEFFDQAVAALGNRCPWLQSRDMDLASFLMEVGSSCPDEDRPGSMWLIIDWPYPIDSRDGNGVGARWERTVYFDAELHHQLESNQ